MAMEVEPLCEMEEGLQKLWWSEAQTKMERNLGISKLRQEAGAAMQEWSRADPQILPEYRDLRDVFLVRRNPLAR